jgi:hypothetical protein
LDIVIGEISSSKIVQLPATTENGHFSANMFGAESAAFP